LERGLFPFKGAKLIFSDKRDLTSLSTPTEMETSYNCSTNFAEIASGGVPYELGSFGVPYTVVLVFLAFLMGLGKGGVPGSSTTSVALNSLLAPSGPGCLDATVALGVPITFLADVMVVVSYLKLARWDVILRLLPPTGNDDDDGRRRQKGQLLKTNTLLVHHRNSLCCPPSHLSVQSFGNTSPLSLLTPGNNTTTTAIRGHD
jgi:hypothetical protein